MLEHGPILGLHERHSRHGRQGDPGMLYPFSFIEFCRVQANGSIARPKGKQDSGSPCQTPLVALKGLLMNPFIITLVCACSYSVQTVLMNLTGRLKVCRVSIR